MPAYHSGKLSQTGRPNFVNPLRPLTPDLTVPFAPRNLMVTSPYKIGMTDIRWDNPKLIPQNSGLNILGCNVYRCTDSPYGFYEKINTTPVGVLYFRDETQDGLTVEDATPTVRQSTEPDKRWLIYSQRKPIVQPGSNGKISDRIQDVKIEVDDGDGNFLEVPAFSVYGHVGEITLISSPTFNYEISQLLPPRLPWPPTGRVRLTYSYLKNQVLSVLNQRINYKVTTVAVDPNDNTKQIETPIDEVEWRCTADIEEIDYIWKEAIRRNRWILDQAGERVKVFTRRWMGELCPEYQDAFGQSHNDCHTCFPAGTPIRTSNGWEDIEKIKMGDYVLSGDGLYHKVLKNFENDFKGDLISIYPTISTRPILATPDHPYFVLRGNHKKKKCGPNCNKFIEEGDGFPTGNPNVRQLPGGRWWARAQMGGLRNKGRKTLGTFSTKEEAVNAVYDFRLKNYKQGHILQWDKSENLQEGDWLVSQWFKGTQDITEIAIPEQYLTRSNFGPELLGPQKFIVDEDFLWMVGLYIAEGSSGTRCINFSLHLKEKEYQNRLIKIFKNYGYNPVISKAKAKGLGVNVIVSSSILAEWFPQWLGTKCDKKQIPNEFMYLPGNKIQALIQGIYDGDGSKRGHEIGQTSEYLAMQLVELLHRINEQPLIRQQKAKSLTPKGNKRKIAYCVNWAEHGFDHSSRKGRWDFKGDLLSKIKKISKVPFSGKVYNLEIEDDHSYIVNGVVVHNCFGTNYVGGYSGPYDMVIAPPEAEKMIELMDMGLHINYSFETWTGPFPMLNERDIIIRQNNERYIVGPVNYQGSRGAIYQQHFTIAYVDEGDIRYQVGISGGETSVPASTDLYRQPTLLSPASPVIPVKPTIAQERLIKGRTVCFENISY